MGLAYVDFTTPDRVKTIRCDGIESSSRNESVENNLLYFENMKNGLVDAFESVTESYCTMEFCTRRDQYYWPVLALKEKFNLMAAQVLEFIRLNIEGVELSKRKIVPLIESKQIQGLDDPRIYTIRGLRRRGFTPEILKKLYHMQAWVETKPLLLKN